MERNEEELGEQLWNYIAARKKISPPEVRPTPFASPDVARRNGHGTTQDSVHKNGHSPPNPDLPDGLQPLTDALLAAMHAETASTEGQNAARARLAQAVGKSR